MAENQQHPGGEIVVGLVGPLGTDLTEIAALLANELRQVDYRTHVHRLSRYMRDLPGAPWSLLKDDVRDREVAAHMEAGNELRKRLRTPDAMALLGVLAIQDVRLQLLGKDSQEQNKDLGRFAHILHSLKRKEEVATLRRIYGPAFIAIAAHSPREQRLADLADHIRRSHHATKASLKHQSAAAELIERDEKELGTPFGQNVQDTFPEADFIINAADFRGLQRSVQRIVELLFGNSFHTPTPDEQAMKLAHAAALRSSSLARQVGAVICRPDGSVVSVGANDVPRAGGGQYWCSHENDGRDFRWGYDTSDFMRRNLLEDILQRLKDAQWLSEEHSKKETGELVHAALGEKLKDGRALMDGAQFNSTIDYIRAVHAEMAAVTEAARHGVDIKGCTLYCTTFPCHECAKHIVAAGIARVVYSEAYPKSLVKELFPDSIVVDPLEANGAKVRFEPFVGVAHRRYDDVFRMEGRRRKDGQGAVVRWDGRSATPYFQTDKYGSLFAKLRERSERLDIEALFKNHGLRP